MQVHGANEPSEFELQTFSRLLEKPERWWTEAELYAIQPALVRDIKVVLAESGWLTVDERGRFQLTEAGVGSLTWIVRTGGKERGLVGTFLWEGGSSARQRFQARHGKRHSLMGDEAVVFDDPADALFDRAQLRGFWWTLPRYGLNAARLARIERRNARNARRGRAPVQLP